MTPHKKTPPVRAGPVSGGWPKPANPAKVPEIVTKDSSVANKALGLSVKIKTAVLDWQLPLASRADLDALDLVHFAAERLTEIHRVEEQRDHFKPRGLWVSVENAENGWREWCEGEGFSLDNLAERTPITIEPSVRIALLSSARDIDDFTGAFGRDLVGIENYQIDWTAVALHCDGIIITPYIWSRRLHDGVSWYYAWDCASGCLWNAGAIKP